MQVVMFMDSSCLSLVEKVIPQSTIKNDKDKSTTLMSRKTTLEKIIFSMLLLKIPG